MSITNLQHSELGSSDSLWKTKLQCNISWVLLHLVLFCTWVHPILAHFSVWSFKTTSSFICQHPSHFLLNKEFSVCLFVTDTNLLDTLIIRQKQFSLSLPFFLYKSVFMSPLKDGIIYFLLDMTPEEHTRILATPGRVCCIMGLTSELFYFYKFQIGITRA